MMSTPSESSSEKADRKVSESEITNKENDALTEEQQSQLEALVPKVTDAVETLKNCTDYNSQESFNAFEVLSTCSETNPLCRRLADHIVKLNVAIVFPLAWKQLKETANSVEGDSKKRTLTILLSIKSSFTNFTDVSPRLCQQLGEQKAFKLLFEEFAQDFQVVEELEDEMKKSQFEGSLGILHNCIRLWKGNISLYREANAVQLLTKYVRSNHPLANKTKCLLTLSYIVDDEESGNLATQDGSVTYLLDLLKKAVSTPEHKIDCGYIAFSVAELLDGLNHVATNDCNKVKIVEGGGISILSEIIQQDFSQEEHTLSARGLWTLAFVVSNRDIIKKQQKILQVLGAFRTSSFSALRKAGEGALWEISGGRNATEGSKTSQSSPSGGHVMISYQWQAQKMMKHLKEGLVKAGYNVWMDIDKAEGNMLESMANAVENSVIVLIAVSERYKNSLNCRSEASYAYRLKKPMVPIMVQEGYKPDGWLGILIAMNKYYKCYTDAMIDEQLPSLIHALGDKGRL